MRRKRQYEKKKQKKRGRRIPYIYKDRIYFGKKTETGTGVVLKVIAHLFKRWRRYQNLMVKRKCVWYINLKKTHKRKKKKKNKKHGKGFGDGFKFLYSLGKQWHNSMQ